jgi:membrane fusion protein (multidrug efflux system)
MVGESRIFGTAMVNALTVPGDAIVHDARGVALVYVYYPAQRRVFARRVELGALLGNEVEIKSGLRADDQIVVAGQQNVREGSSARITGDQQ